MRSCEDCGEPIPPKRLELLPKTKVCVACQEVEEKAGRSKRHTMEIAQELNGWQCEQVVTRIIREDE